MNTYLLIDKDEGVIPLTRIIAEDEIDALSKAIRGILNDNILTVEDICECLGINLKEITDVTTYE